MEEVGQCDGGQSIVKVCGWFVRTAEGAMRQDVGTVGEVEKPCIQRSDLRPQDGVGFGKARGSAGEVEACEEDIVRGLEAGGCCGEDVFRSEVGESGGEGEEGGDEEDGERLGDGLGDRLHRDMGGDCLDILCAVPAYELREEQGPQGEEECFEAVGMSVES